MSEATQTPAAKAKAEVVAVQMTDGRTVNFPGKRKVQKETIIDESKIVIEGDVMQLQAGAVKVRMDFRNGQTRTIPLPLSLFARFAGHGGEQKFGDELASSADKPLSEEDMVIAIDDLNGEIQKGNWGKGRASGGGGVSGAHIVVQALMEISGKDQETVKAYLQGLLDKNPDLTRRAMYDSFRAEGTKTGAVIKRLEAEKGKKAAAVNADDALAGLGVAA